MTQSLSRSMEALLSDLKMNTSYFWKIEVIWSRKCLFHTPDIMLLIVMYDSTGCFMCTAGGQQALPSCTCNDKPSMIIPLYLFSNNVGSISKQKLEGPCHEGSWSFQIMVSFMSSSEKQSKLFKFQNSYYVLCRWDCTTTIRLIHFKKWNNVILRYFWSLALPLRNEDSCKPRWCQNVNVI